jgi:hypothetical protein
MPARTEIFVKFGAEWISLAKIQFSFEICEKKYQGFVPENNDT